jgi:hypothetical protein
MKRAAAAALALHGFDLEHKTIQWSAQDFRLAVVR